MLWPLAIFCRAFSAVCSFLASFQGQRASRGPWLPSVAPFGRFMSFFAFVEAFKAGGLQSKVAISSDALAVAVPTFATTMPAAWFASVAASSIVAPEAKAPASVAITVSPAPVTS